MNRKTGKSLFFDQMYGENLCKEVIMTVKQVFIHEPRTKEYVLLDEITDMDNAPVRTWKLVFIDGMFDTVHFKTGKNKSRRFSANNISKGLKAYMLLLGYSI